MNRACLWLADVMVGRELDWLLGVEIGADQLLRWAQEQDVVAIVDWRLQQSIKHHSVPSSGAFSPKTLEIAQVFSAASKPYVLTSMVQEAEVKRILAVMEGLGLDGLLLKGSALAYWAFPQPHLRACSDVDLLLPTYADGRKLADGLCAAVGYVQSDRNEDMGYEFMCKKYISRDIFLEVDVHWRLVNSPLFAEVFTYSELAERAVELGRLAPNAKGLSGGDALIHASLHRAANLASEGHDILKWLYDIHVLCSALHEHGWDQVVETCEAKKLSKICLAAIDAMHDVWPDFDCMPARVRQRLLELSATEPMDVGALLNWRSTQRMSFYSIPTWIGRLRWLGERVFPSRSYLRAIYGRSSAGYGRLMLIRMARMFVRLIGK